MKGFQQLPSEVIVQILKLVSIEFLREVYIGGTPGFRELAEQILFENVLIILDSQEKSCYNKVNINGFKFGYDYSANRVICFVFEEDLAKFLDFYYEAISDVHIIKKVTIKCRDYLTEDLINNSHQNCESNHSTIRKFGYFNSILEKFLADLPYLHTLEIVCPYLKVQLDSIQCNFLKISIFDSDLLTLNPKLRNLNLNMYKPSRAKISDVLKYQNSLFEHSNLSSLTIDNSLITKLNGEQFKSLGQNLVTLSLKSNKIAQLQKLDSPFFATLKKLDVSFNYLSFTCSKDTVQAINLPTLEELNLSNNDLGKIDKFQKCFNLKKLNLSECKLFKINNLSNFVNLEDLNLMGNCITKIENIEDLINLDTLNLSFNDICCVNVALKRNNKLRCLSLKSNSISEVIRFDNFNQLQKLDLSHNKLKDLSNLKSLPKIEKLWLQYNHILQIGPLRVLKNLAVLNLSNNLVENLSSLEGLKRLVEVNLNNNNLNVCVAIEVLERLPNLHFAYLYHNNICKSIAPYNRFRFGISNV